MTINEHMQSLPELTWKDLYKSTLKAPFQLRGEDDSTFIGEEIVRIMPRRRVVVFGSWRGRPVVAKLFYNKHAKRRLQKDARGIKILRENRIPTPRIFYQGRSKDKHIHILIIQRIFEAKTLEEICEQKTSAKTMLPLLKQVVIEIATQHVLGVLQHDLHLKNFLLTKKTMFTLDGTQIEKLPYLLPKKTSMQNLGLFFAQLGVGFDAYYELLFRHYAKARGWLLKEDDMHELRKIISDWNNLRWQKYEKKVFRSSSDFARIKEFSTKGMFNKHLSSPELESLLRKPDTLFQHPSAQILKNGRSTTVIKINLNQREFVVKRHNVKNIWHFLRRCFRYSRARQSWRLAHKLHLFGIVTASPVAFIERRVFGLQTKAYYITEYINGQQADEYFISAADTKLNEMVNRITTLLKNIAKLEVSHGDLKISNILINEREQPVLIDLDGTVEHLSLTSLQKAWHKEIKRFLRNFQSQPTLCEKFETALNISE